MNDQENRHFHRRRTTNVLRVAKTAFLTYCVLVFLISTKTRVWSLIVPRLFTLNIGIDRTLLSRNNMYNFICSCSKCYREFQYLKIKLESNLDLLDTRFKSAHPPTLWIHYHSSFDYPKLIPNTHLIDNDLDAWPLLWSRIGLPISIIYLKGWNSILPGEWYWILCKRVRMCQIQKCPMKEFLLVWNDHTVPAGTCSQEWHCGLICFEWWHGLDVHSHCPPRVTNFFSCCLRLSNLFLHVALLLSYRKKREV